jgi:hypothetical protein
MGRTDEWNRHVQRITQKPPVKTVRVVRCSLADRMKYSVAYVTETKTY